MYIYVSGLILTLLFAQLREKYPRKQYCSYRLYNTKLRVKKINIFDILTALPLTIIAAFRYEVGADYSNTYVNIFNKVLYGHADQAWGDILYTYLNKFVLLFTNDFVGIFIVTAFIFSFFVFSSVFTQSKNVKFSLFLLVCTGYYFCFLNGMRQLIAAAILLYSLKFINEKDYKNYFFCVAIASLFHLSALVFLPIILLDYLKLNNVKRIIIIVSVFILSQPISSILVKYLALTKYAYHLESVDANIGFVTTFINLCVFLFCSFWNKDKTNELYLNLQMLFLCIQSFLGLIPSANRIGWYFGLPIIILLPNVLASRKVKENKLIVTAIVVLYFVYFIYTVGFKNSNLVLPYKWIFER